MESAPQGTQTAQIAAITEGEQHESYFQLLFVASELDPVRFGTMGLQPTDPPGEELPPLRGALAEVVPFRLEEEPWPEEKE